jgi:hypothetical protein
MTMTDKEISPAACAVLGALEEVAYDWASMEQASPRDIAAAVLRAAANQVAPEFWHEDDDVYGETIQDVRQQLLAIADEL